jgi:hypothetical protein
MPPSRRHRHGGEEDRREEDLHRYRQVTTRSSATVVTHGVDVKTDWTTAATETGVSVFTTAARGLIRLGRYPARATLSELTCTMAVSSLQGRPAD